MTEAVKDVAQAIRDNKPTDVHPDLYKAVMDVLEYSPDALMAALNHLVDQKAQGITLLLWEPPIGPSGSGVTYPSTTSICSGYPRAFWGWGDMPACLWANDDDLVMYILVVARVQKLVMAYK
jgi:hypothetical protein